MSKSAPPKRLLHLVFGGELESLDGTTFRDLHALDIVGIYPNYAEAHAAWKSADPLSFIRARDKDHQECKYPTTVQAVWTPDGITFGFRMTEPTTVLRVPIDEGHVPNVAVQVELVLHHPAAAAQVAQHRARQAGAHEGRLVAALQAQVERFGREGFRQRRRLVLPALDRFRRRRRRFVVNLIGDDRLCSGNRLAKQCALLLGRRAPALHPRLSRYFSASSAAMQPVPALVTACL